MTLKQFPQCGKGKLLTVALLAIVSPYAEGACDLVSTPGSDTQTCDSGGSGAVTWSGANDTLIFPAAGSGSINGNVTFGPGLDSVDMNSGRITGNVTQGAGRDRFSLSAGIVTGDISQGAEPDTFVMSGGSIGSLAQGDGLDTFQMTGGIITRAFEDGDRATMSGGSIGRVDMKLDDNLFDLSSGTIIGNLVTGFGRDTINVSGGRIGGAVSVSGGDDQLTLSGGEILGGIRASFGNDQFTWRDGGNVTGSVLMAEGDDIARLYNLSEYYLSTNNVLDGGTGNDTLTLDNTTSAVPARYRQWETVNLSNGSRMDLAGDLTLGDSASGTGVLNMDVSSRLSSTSGAIRSFNSATPATLNNAGTLDLSSGFARDTLTVQGNYTGLNGQLLVQSVLGGDSADSDRLVIAQGRIGGTTRMTVINEGGPGALTQSNGIEVVQAIQGATSDNGAFSLENSLSVGAYQYYLFKGGATAGSENSWFLRSSVLSPPLTIASLPAEPDPAPEPEPTPTPAPPTPTPPPEPESPAEPTPPAPEPTAPTIPQPAATLPVPAVGTPPLPEPLRGAAPVALYRQEVPNYSVIAPAAALLAMSSLGTFHERQGDQHLLNQQGARPAGWARVFGSDLKQHWSGTVSPSLDASLEGYQIGHDLFAWQPGDGAIQRVGIFVANNRLKGRIKGFAGGFEDTRTGRLSLRGDSIGAYWTLIGPRQGYVDAVAMGTRLDGSSRSERGVRVDLDGHLVSLSIEAGYPLPVGANWVAEPQVQVIHQRVDLDDQHDGISSLEFDSPSRNTGRLGIRLKGRYRPWGVPVEPYMRTDLWRDANGHDTVIYQSVDRIRTEHDSKTASLGAGLVAQPSEHLGVYLSADHRRELSGSDTQQTGFSVGIRLSW
ncbi:autotransporter domain-containing protein [Pseudomonas viridiflava]|uniref:autotransporter family protein n=1 Tax=Pseudomonas viridiflava TaxID=33069 RepID=UPI0018E5CB02|nr:autotransporter domain-containing protein [Pseudomonas viridiflava]MBI6576369.1 autotransporter domain-containing protein [Pseudomonas viridiflava]MBI6608458.1 autotransporter domain-containing protein [Pseudomonas viridiflava]MBI6638257.1 autotransporter domain-containing protein [Pseudomonas viridiflava]MBI6869072.1 autotransporter domain-containing protein [Pseudomonas viridiflava]